jgi:hypothetical protein
MMMMMFPFIFHPFSQQMRIDGFLDEEGLLSIHVEQAK